MLSFCFARGAADCKGDIDLELRFIDICIRIQAILPVAESSEGEWLLERKDKLQRTGKVQELIEGELVNQAIERVLATLQYGESG